MYDFFRKRILFICKESFSYPLFYLAKKWRKENKIAGFFFNPIESKYTKCFFNEHTYYKWAEAGIKIYDSSRIAAIFAAYKKDNIIDAGYLREIESKYTHYLNINQQIVSSQYLTAHYHYRSYRGLCTYNQQLNWLILNYKNINHILDQFKPDIVLDLDSAELARTILRELCYKRSIPYISIDFPRFESYKIATYNLGWSINDDFKNLYLAAYKLDHADLMEEAAYVDKFRNSVGITTAEHKDIVSVCYKPEHIYHVIKKLYGKYKYLADQDKSKINRKLKKSSKVLYNDSKGMFYYFFRIELRKQLLTRHNKYFLLPRKEEIYVYMPLHLIPESTTFTLAPFYINEMSIIEAVSKSLPAGWYLYVKEHPAMLGERNPDFYKRANKIPNVRMVQYNYYNDPKPWIMNSRGVVTISGTTAYEAAMLGRPAAVFAEVPFELLEGVTRVRSFEDLPFIFKEFRSCLDNRHSCAAYIRAVKQMGVEFNLNYMIAEGEKIADGRVKASKKYVSQLENLARFYVEAYDRINDTKDKIIEK